ncbi:PREDICTED: transposon CACTA [Prunus dulcis]|uniref:PREDICTED: transposon CACTA n=1 Tax=Prunus dulcis TaxID=3755 RepID=A0A5E4G7X6_PRUDU|nr:PREDICTED: transposon CACTA [Prunus dulcis]
MLLRMSLELYWAWTERTKIHLMPKLDLKELNIKEKFHHKTIGERTVFCGTTFTLTKNEKALLCKVLASVRLLDGLSSNIARCAREKENKLLGIKSHDCDIIMKYFLPIGVLCALSTEVVPGLLELSSFFQNLSTKVGTAIYFHSLPKSVAVLFCELEKLLPPIFFVIMLHLLIHLPDEAAIVGLVHYRWMYPIEWFLYTLKKYVRNKSRLEGSIVEGYIVEECLSFCALYLGDGTVHKRNKPGRNVDAQGSDMREGFEIFKGPSKSLGRVKSFHLDHQEWDRVHRHVFWNTPEVQPYIRCDR